MLKPAPVKRGLRLDVASFCKDFIACWLKPAPVKRGLHGWGVETYPDVKGIAKKYAKNKETCPDVKGIARKKETCPTFAPTKCENLEPAPVKRGLRHDH